MARQRTSRLDVSGYLFVLRRVERALLRREVPAGDDPVHAPAWSLLAGLALTTVLAAGCAVLAVLRPHGSLGDAPIVMARESGALYVRLGDTLHPVLNLASARLIVQSDSDPRPVAESELRATKRGPLLGIPGAPQSLPEPLAAGDDRWAVCDAAAPGTTAVVDPVDTPSSHRLTPAQALLVTPDSGGSTYLVYDGRRAVVDLAEPAVVHALRLENAVPQPVSRILLNAIPEAPPIAPPRISGAGGRGPATLPGFPVGSVLRLTRADGDEYYVVLGDGVQRVGHAAADLIRFTDSRGTRTIVAVAPDLIRATPTVDELAVSTFPDQVATLRVGDGAALCVIWAAVEPGSAATSVLVGGLPIPAGHAAVTLAQADGTGPALDAVYLPPGRAAYVRATGLSGSDADGGTRHLIIDTGVCFGIRDDGSAGDLGLPATALPAPWPVLAALPSGPELSRSDASVARDSLAAAGVRVRPGPP
ncbi:type VII secretion protein EccB [Mycobacterium sp.]|uniref:type VII secretion protein EccB n=1 Tax=Mycobacterium sp. TaxID=1785 RepID=UPI0031CF3DC4